MIGAGAKAIFAWSTTCAGTGSLTVIRVCSWIAVLGRRRGGAAVGRRNVIFDASLQPGTGSGVGGKGRWTAIAVPPQTESAGGRGKIATVSSGGAGK